MTAHNFGPWYFGREKPEHGPGIYQRRLPSGHIRFALWTGAHWRVSANHPDSAALRVDASVWQELLWRGLAVDPIVKNG